MLFTGVPARTVVLGVRRHRPLGSCSPVCPLGALFCECGVPGHLAPVHRCARSVCCVTCAVSRTTCLLFTGVLARCVVLRMQRPRPLGSCSSVCPLQTLCQVCGVLGHLTPDYRCARSGSSPCCAVSWATCLLFTGVTAWRIVLLMRRPGPLGCCSAMCPLRALCCVCRVLGHLTPVHRCACSVCVAGYALSWATWLLYTGVPARCVVLRVRCPGPLGCCSPVCPLEVLCWVCGGLGHLGPVHRSALSVRCAVCAVSWATWLLFTGVLPRCVVLCVRCPVPLGSFSPVCPLGVLCYVCGVLGNLDAVHRCARSKCCAGCAVSWATWLLFTGVPARCVVLRLRWPWQLGFCSLVCSLSASCCVCGVLGHLAPFSSVCSLGALCCVCGAPVHLTPFHRCARLVSCAGCAVSRPLGPFSLVCPLGASCYVLWCPGPLGSCLPCARSVCCAGCAVSVDSWLLFMSVPAQRVALRVRCPGPLGSCSPECLLGALCCVCGVAGHLALVHLPPMGVFFGGGWGMGPRPPLTSCPYTIIYNLRAETNHVSKVCPAVSKFYNPAPQNDRLDVLMKEIHFVFKTEPVSESR